MPASDPFPSNPYYTLFKKQLDNRQNVSNRSVRKRISVLHSFEKKILENRFSIREALYTDFKKPATEADITEIYPVLKEIRYAKSNLRNWMRPEVLPNGLAFIGTSNKVIRTAKGCCLVIAPWNYPVLLTLGPLVSAIAGGNTVILKPCELTAATSALMARIISELFNEDEIAVVEGDGSDAEKLLELPFDHILFTGSAETGKKVMMAAAKNLSSLTLELGGKSPAYVHADANIQDAASKITAAKLVNAGQTCIAPDFIIAHRDVADDLVAALEKSFITFFDKDINDTQENFASIISDVQYARLEKLVPMQSQDPHLKAQKIFVPVIIENTNLDDLAMKEEIFGPVLPVIRVTNTSEALKIIHQLPEPLSVYIFTRNRKLKNMFLESTRSGSICINECAVHFLHPALPFGGIHKSGIGRTHGKAGFLTFTEERVIFKQRTGFTMAKLLYPPYNSLKKKMIDVLLKYF